MKPCAGDKGGEATLPAASLGSLGVGAFVGRSLGRGLSGRPGLRGTFALANCSDVSADLCDVPGLSIPASELGCDKNEEVNAGVGSGAKALTVVGMLAVCAVLEPSLSANFAFLESDLDFELFCCLLWLRFSSSCFCRTSLSISSSSVALFVYFLRVLCVIPYSI